MVKHLVCNAERTYPDQGPFPESDELDQKRHTRNTLCPLDADSSQLAAVFAAEEGLTFVLEGPPGTGKSQTITNLVSQSLAAGKTVLFVSEKMAALDVVHRRLESVGLGEFCLELHSNKARKKEVLARLGRSWEAMSTQAPGDWVVRAAELDSLRRQLNAYVEALHLPRQGGESYFEVVSRLMPLRQAPRVRIAPGDPSLMSQQRLAELREIVARMSTASAPVGSPATHPFGAVQITSPQAGLRRAACTCSFQATCSAATPGPAVGAKAPRAEETWTTRSATTHRGKSLRRSTSCGESCARCGGRSGPCGTWPAPWAAPTWSFDSAASPYNMPELKWRFGYPALWGMAVVTVIGMLVFFRHRGWIGRGRNL